MTNRNGEYAAESRRGGLMWLYVPVLLILITGAALSVAAYNFSDVDLSVAESIAAGFGGLAAIIVALIAAAFGVMVGLIGALLGLLAAGGAIAITLFIIASPAIAIILLIILMRRKGQPAPEASAH